MLRVYPSQHRRFYSLGPANVCLLFAARTPLGAFSRGALFVSILYRNVLTMGILLWILFGLIAGAIAKVLMPGEDPGGFIVTILIGIVGAVLGGWLGSAIFGVGVSGFNLPSFLVAIGGAVLLLIIYRAVT